MKFPSVLSALALFGVAIAAPAGGGCGATLGLSKRQIPQQYAITLKTGFKELNNKQLSIDSNMVGVYPPDSDAKQLRVTLNTIGKKTDKKFSFRPYPASNEEHTLALVGINGYLELKDLDKPSGHKSLPKETYSWKEFTLGKPDKKCMQEIIYKNVKPGWTASPAGNDTWRIKNYDGDIVVVQNYIPVKLYLEPVAFRIDH